MLTRCNNGWAKCKPRSRIDMLARQVTPTAESVSVPYSNPMFDVPDVSRFYRCSITDVHIGRSLVYCVFSLLFCFSSFQRWSPRGHGLGLKDNWSCPWPCAPRPRTWPGLHVWNELCTMSLNIEKWRFYSTFRQSPCHYLERDLLGNGTQVRRRLTNE